ncbi:MAG TPA: DUF3105 domain-containing protein [Polyangiaceae bacterium]|nr:DUF3105 domain-containing protein [Polyangiaceae bacterium]
MKARCASLLVPLVLACGAEAEPARQDPACGADAASVSVTSGEFSPVTVPDSECGATTTQESLELGLHVRECSALTYTSNPPSSGEHYPSWAAFREFTEAVPRGYWVHSLEHGAVAIVYRCSDCASEIEAARAMIAALPEESACAGTGAARRVVMTPDPLLDVRWAAAAWGFTLRSDCFEPTVFRDFVLAHIGRGPEDTCSPGLGLWQ